MPVILITGIPSSGKSYRCNELRTYFENERKRKVLVISENEIIRSSKTDKNDAFNDSAKEKTIRAQMMSDAVRLMNTDDVLIIDAGNYIKGYRYELYCAIKNNGTTQCLIHCALPVETAWQWNCERDEKEQYNRNIFDALVMRYEAPDSRNRWDSPLVTVFLKDDLPFENVYQLLYERKPPPPNQSVQGNPVTPENFLRELDRITHEIISAILSAQKLGLEGDVKVPGYNVCVEVNCGSKLTSPQLARLRRQFLTYTKMQPPKDSSQLGQLFIQYLSSNLR
ncbi:protein KTI12 homolog [Anabrus simplex]|uniref:protein KTI12 homolog n=1 Tax=Anabrus simplex TaxID=316456 RepID=UPI0035A346BA